MRTQTLGRYKLHKSLAEQSETNKKQCLAVMCVSRRLRKPNIDM